MAGKKLIKHIIMLSNIIMAYPETPKNKHLLQCCTDIINMKPDTGTITDDSITGQISLYHTIDR